MFIWLLTNRTVSLTFEEDCKSLKQEGDYYHTAYWMKSEAKRKL